MTSKTALKLLKEMRMTKSGWGQKDFRRLLEGFGFINKGGRKHDKYYHPEFSSLWISVPRHNKLKEWVATDAVKLIDKLNSFTSVKEKANK